MTRRGKRCNLCSERVGTGHVGYSMKIHGDTSRAMLQLGKLESIGAYQNPVMINGFVMNIPGASIA